MIKSKDYPVEGTSDEAEERMSVTVKFEGTTIILADGRFTPEQRREQMSNRDRTIVKTLLRLALEEVDYMPYDGQRSGLLINP